MATKEEYLQKYEEIMLEKLFDDYKSMNKNLLFLYTLLFILMLLELGFVHKLSIGGTEFNIDVKQRQLLLPILILIPYMLVNNSLRNIIRIVERLKINSSEIMTLNSEARPFLVDDLEIYSTGIAGIQFQLSKWIVKRKLPTKMDIEFKIPNTKKNFKGKLDFTLRLPMTIIFWSNQLGAKLMLMGLWIILLVVLYVIPLLVSIIFIYKNSLSPLFMNFKVEILFSQSLWLAIFLMAMVIYTLISNWKLYTLYFSELITLRYEVTNVALLDLVRGARKMITFYKT